MQWIRPVITINITHQKELYHGSMFWQHVRMETINYLLVVGVMDLENNDACE